MSTPRGESLGWRIASLGGTLSCKWADECVRISDRHDESAQPCDRIVTQKYISAVQDWNRTNNSIHLLIWCCSVGRSLCAPFLRKIYLTAHFISSPVSSRAAGDILVTTLQSFLTNPRLPGNVVLLRPRNHSCDPGRRQWECSICYKHR
jgi:hypothetical protein